MLLAAKLKNDCLYELCDLPSSHNYSPNKNSISTLSPMLSDFGHLPRMLTSAPNTKTSAQGAKLAVKPTFYISHGDTGGECDDLWSDYDPIFATILPTKPTVLLSETNTVKPTTSVLYPHLFAKAAYYHTAKFPNLDP